ncbi:MAG: hypothetical protein P8179_13495 [Candidatus Thiodiazotropha sp.]
MKGAFVVVQGRGRSCTSMFPQHLCIPAQHPTPWNSPLFQGVATPPQACHSCCSVIHPIGEDKIHQLGTTYH